MRRRRSLLAILALTVALVSACAGQEPAAGSGSDQGPIKLVGLWEIKGESAAAVNDYNNGALLGVEAVNAAGGIAGRQVVLERVAADPLNPQKATAQFLEAVDKKPDMLVGFASATALISAKSQIDRAGIPLLAAASATAPLRFGAPGASEWSWYVQPYDEFKNETAVRYVTEDLKATRVGLMGTNEAYGTTNIKSQTELLAKEGITPVAVRTYDPAATDLTQSVLAMKDAQAVISFTYPNPLAVQLKQFEQNGMRIPMLSSSSATLAVNNKLVTGPPLDNLNAVVPCDPASSSDPKQKAFLDTYVSRFNEPPTNLAVGTHDAIWIAKAAIEKAGSTDHEAVNKAMADIAVTDNVLCTDEYRADGGHLMNRQMAVVKYAADDKPTEVRRFTFPELPAATS